MTDHSRFTGVFRDAVDHYWASRGKSSGVSAGAYGGRRSEVVGGKQLDGFLFTIAALLVDCGIPADWIYWRERGSTCIPGWFRATKNWDLLLVESSRLGADTRLWGALELKVLGGPSFGNNANNRAEEAIGNAVDVWTAYREHAYRDQPEPFLGYLIMVEEDPRSRKPVGVTETHFDVLPEFRDKSYVERMCLLCERLMAERLYQAACTIVSGTSMAGTKRNYSEPDAAVGVNRFLNTMLRMCVQPRVRLDAAWTEPSMVADRSRRSHVPLDRM